MDTKKTKQRSIGLTPDSQHRLLAYSTAAGLGAFFSGQHADAQMVESGQFSSYPVALNVGSGTAGYNYLNIDGKGNDFNLDISGTRATLGGEVRPAGWVSKGAADLVTAFNDTPLNPSKDSYVIPWTTSGPIGTTSFPLTSPYAYGSVPTYKNWLAEDSGGKFLFNNVANESVVGFAFTSGGNEYFGYMLLSITASDPVVGQTSSFTSATLDGLYYNETAGAAATVVPEPSTLSLLAIGVAGMGARAVRRKKKQ